MTKPFAGFSFRGFWNDSKYARESYIEREPTRTLVASIEEALGYTLPASYVWLMTRHNGGILTRSCFPTKKRTSWAEDHVAVHGISSIGRKKAHALCGALGSEFMLDEWGYAPNFVTDWFDARLKDRTIVRTKKGLTFSPKAAARVAKKLKTLTSS